MLSPPPPSPTCHHKKGAACLYFAMQLFEFSLIYNLLLNSVCVLVYFKEKPRPNIYIAPPVLYVYISSPSCAAPGCSVYAGSQKLIIIIRSRKSSCPCLFRSLLARSPSLSSHNFIIMPPFFPKRTVLHELCGRSLLAISNHSMVFFPLLKPTRNPFFLFLFKRVHRASRQPAYGAVGEDM